MLFTILLSIFVQICYGLPQYGLDSEPFNLIDGGSWAIEATRNTENLSVHSKLNSSSTGNDSLPAEERPTQIGYFLISFLITIPIFFFIHLNTHRFLHILKSMVIVPKNQKIRMRP